MKFNLQRFFGLCILVGMTLGLFSCCDHENNSLTSPTDDVLTRERAKTSSQSDLPDGYFDIFEVASLHSTLPEAFAVDEGMAVSSTSEAGYLCFGQNRTGYSVMPLSAVFSISIDNNTADDQDIVVLDVYDNTSGSVLATQTISRKDFSEANAFSLFELDFVPPSTDASLEFRIYYLGWAYVIAHKIAVINPSQVSLDDTADQLIPATSGSVLEESVTTSGTSSSDNSDFCSGDEVICLDGITATTVAKYQGQLYGGSYQNGQFFSTGTGGIVFPLTLQVGRSYSIEFEIEDNIANVYSGEEDGGKVSLLTISGTNSNYYLSLQRMYNGYRGRGVFRVMLADRSDILGGGTAFLITHSSLAGGYSMTNWGSESHAFNLNVNGGSCQLGIDDFQSTPATARYSIGGTRSVQLVIGNREASRIGVGQGAITTFNKFKLSYQ